MLIAKKVSILALCFAHFVISISIGITLLLFSYDATAKTNIRPERWYQIVWCLASKGEMEVRMSDESRIDCLTPEHAVEIEFASKWPEALGQSLHYGLLSKRTPGIVLIIKSPRDLEDWSALKKIIKTYELPIKVWKMHAKNYSH